jgi:hypothetical protein
MILLSYIQLDYVAFNMRKTLLLTTGLAWLALTGAASAMGVTLNEGPADPQYFAWLAAGQNNFTLGDITWTLVSGAAGTAKGTTPGVSADQCRNRRRVALARCLSSASRSNKSIVGFFASRSSGTLGVPLAELFTEAGRAERKSDGLKRGRRRIRPA